MTFSRDRFKGATALASISALSLLAVAGCSSDDSGDSAGSGTKAPPARSGAATSSEQPAEETASPTSSKAGTSAGPGPDADLAKTTFPVNMATALTTARKASSGGTVTKIELEFDKVSDSWVWKIDSQRGSDQHETKIDAVSGKVIANDRDHESANPRAVTPKKLTPADALAKATKKVPGAVSEWSLEYDDGTQRYQVEIATSGGTTQDVVVDVGSGRVTQDD